MLKGQASTAMIVIAAVVVLAGLGIIIWKVAAAPSAAEPVIVKPANPDDPKFKPNPKLNLSGGGA